MSTKKSYLDIVTPIGTFLYPYITRPNVHDPENTYSPRHDQYEVKIAFDKGSEEWKELLEIMRPIEEEGKAVAKDMIDSLPAAKRKKFNIKDFKWYREEEDRETGELTGRMIIAAKTQAELKLTRGPRAGETIKRTVPVFDSDGNIMRPCPEIWGGTTGRLSCRVAPYFIQGSNLMGLTFYLNAVQVYSLVSSGGSVHTFGKLEGGYTHENKEAENGSGYQDEEEASGVEDGETDFDRGATQEEAARGAVF